MKRTKDISGKRQFRHELGKIKDALSVLGKRVNESNSLAANKPHIAKEWHPSKNNDLYPENVTVQSGKKVWWALSK